MHLEISLNDGVPIYRQIETQIKYLIASSQLKPHVELPAIRVLAEQLSITPNTVVKAYRELESQGVVYKRRGAGTYVSEVESRLARKEQKRILAERVDALLAESYQLKFSVDQLISLVHKRHEVMQKTRENEVSNS